MIGTVKQSPIITGSKRVQALLNDIDNCMTQWLIDIFVLSLLQRYLINCAGVGRRTLYN